MIEYQDLSPDEMNKAELRIAIAEARGATVHQTGYGINYQAEVTWRGETASAGTLVYAHDLAGVPDWPNDPGAALALCLEITEDNNWEITIGPLRKSGRYGADFGDGVMSPHYAEAATPAEALARLALAALGGDA